MGCTTHGIEGEMVNSSSAISTPRVTAEQVLKDFYHNTNFSQIQRIFTLQHNFPLRSLRIERKVTRYVSASRYAGKENNKNMYLKTAKKMKKIGSGDTEADSE